MVLIHVRSFVIVLANVKMLQAPVNNNVENQRRSVAIHARKPVTRHTLAKRISSARPRSSSPVIVSDAKRRFVAMHVRAHQRVPRERHLSSVMMSVPDSSVMPNLPKPSTSPTAIRMITSHTQTLRFRYTRHLIRVGPMLRKAHSEFLLQMSQNGGYASSP